MCLTHVGVHRRYDLVINEHIQRHPRYLIGRGTAKDPGTSCSALQLRTRPAGDQPVRSCSFCLVLDQVWDTVFQVRPQG